MDIVDKVCAGLCAGLFAVAMGFGISACGAGANDSRGKGDAPVGQYEDSPAQVINMPDGFPNVVTKCITYQPGKRVYVVSHGSTDTPPVIVDDPTCGGRPTG